MASQQTQLKQIRKPLIPSDVQDGIAQETRAAAGVTPDEPQKIEISPYMEFADQPRIPLKGVALVVLPGILVALQYQTSSFFKIPTLEYLFISMMVSFLLNYYLVRKHDLYPFLPNESYDNKLKLMCFFALAAFITSVHFGWNGSGGIIVAVVWEAVRGNNIGKMWYAYAAAIIGAILLQGNYSYTKFFQFIPGVLIGIITSTLFTLRNSQPYTIYHELSLISTLMIPVFFPLQMMIKPDLIQWGVMIVGGFLTLFTGLLTIKMMQTERVSVSVAVFSSILILLCTTYSSPLMIGYGVLVLLAVLFVLKHEYFTQRTQL